MFLLGKVLGSLFLPPGSFIVVLAILIPLIALGKKRAAFIIAFAATVSLVLLSFNPFTDLLIAPLETRYPALIGTPKAAAIVVLGGGYIASSPEYEGRAFLSPESLARASYGAILAKRLDLPLVFTGGNPGRPGKAESEADAARRFWLSIGIDDARIELEGKSRDTFENATFTSRSHGGGPFVVVTSAYHMPRAILSFEKAGVGAVPAPTAYRRDGAPRGFLDLLPSEFALETARIALHEYIGLLWYLVRP